MISARFGASPLTRLRAKLTELTAPAWPQLKDSPPGFEPAARPLDDEDGSGE